jgi:hypothetical protein
MTYAPDWESYLKRDDLTPSFRAFCERQGMAKTPAQRLKKDFGRDLPKALPPQQAWTGLESLPLPKAAKPKPPPTARTKRRAMKRALALDANLAKEKAKIDGTGRAFRLRFRRGSKHIVPPSNNVDPLFRIMIWNAIDELECKSYARRGRYQRNGQIGKVGLELMRTILFRQPKSDNGKVYSSYEVLAELTRCCERAVITAMAKLAEFGFVTIHRRCKWIETRFGRRCVQDSNAYEYHLPKTGLGKLAMAVFVGSLRSKSSECTGIREDKHTHTPESAPELDAGMRWWLVEPRQTGNSWPW